MESIPKLPYSELEKRLRLSAPGGRTPLWGSFELTYRCNFRCVHCFQQDCREQAELAAARWCELVDEAVRHGCLWLTLTGGEALLHPGFFEIYERAIRAGLLVTVFSNGSTLTDEVVRRFRRLPPRTLEVSLYGFSAETYAGVTGRPEGFDLAVEGVRRASRAGLAVQVKAMAFDQTIGDLEAIRTFARGLGLGFRFDSAVHGTLGGSTSPLQHRLAPADVVRLEEEEPRAIEQLKIRAASFHPSDRVYQCGAGRQSFTVNPEGAMQLCTLVRSPRFDLARIGFPEAWQAIGHEVERRYEGSERRCSGCDLRFACSWCPGIAEVESGDRQAPVEFFCKIARLRSGRA